jgi:hypothetical protein
VVLKRVRLPTVDARELPEMTRLALQRDLPFDADSAVIDFVRVERGAGSTTVQAAAVPQAALAAARQAARSAGLGVERISLRGTGCAALLGSFDAGGQGGVLAVDIIGERVEFSVVVDGAVRFSRAGELPPADDPAQIADAAVTEARRTWMSYRIVEDADDVRRAVVFGDPRVSELVAGSIGEILGGRACSTAIRSSMPGRRTWARRGRWRGCCWRRGSAPRRSTSPGPARRRTSPPAGASSFWPASARRRSSSWAP